MDDVEMTPAKAVVRLSPRGEYRLRLAVHLFDSYHRAGKTPKGAMEDAFRAASDFIELAEALEEREREAAKQTLEGLRPTVR